jgi:hypothetical protein
VKENPPLLTVQEEGELLLVADPLLEDVTDVALLVCQLAPGAGRRVKEVLKNLWSH